MNGVYNCGDVVLGNWELVRLIGEGSYGKVFEAHRADFGVTYKAAIKIVTIPQSASEIKSARSEGMDEASLTSYFRGVVEDIVQEFILMSRLKGNSNVVSYEDHAVVEHKGNLGWDIIIRMELLTPLLDHVEANEVTRKDVIKLGIDMCKALEVCQRFNIVHRDIKPENIFVSELGDFKLGDFGIARTVEKTTGGLSKKGTYTYMAPEVYKDEPYNSTVDIYSLGVVMYRLLNNNRAPFLPDYPAQIRHSDREKALVQRIGGAEIPTPKNADGRLAEIVLKACAFQPKDRYSSPMQMRQELEAILYRSEEAASIYPKGDITPLMPVEETTPLMPVEETTVGTRIEPTAYVFNKEEVDKLKHNKEDNVAGDKPICTQGRIPSGNDAESLSTSKDEKNSETESSNKVLHEPARNRRWVPVLAIIAVLIVAGGIAYFLLYPQMMYNKGVSEYESGNYEIAVQHFLAAADRQNANAMFRLGVCYDNGNGVSQGRKEAAEWYQKAKDFGYAGPTGYVISSNENTIFTGDTVRITVAPDVECSEVKLILLTPVGEVFIKELGKDESNNTNILYYGDVDFLYEGEWILYAEVSNSAGTYSGSPSLLSISLSVKGERSYGYSITLSKYMLKKNEWFGITVELDWSTSDIDQVVLYCRNENGETFTYTYYPEKGMNAEGTAYCYLTGSWIAYATISYSDGTVYSGDENANYVVWTVAELSE